jgi:cytidylate kinase
MIISISGVPGSGKTTVAKLLAEELKYHFYSMGDLRGKMAMERGITIDELNKIGESDPTTDTSVDDYQRELGTKEDNFVIEGRLSWHFIPSSFKILLTCDPQESAKRIYGARKAGDASRRDEPDYASIDATREELERRTASDILRYQKYYGIDYRDPSHFDLVVDTTSIDGAKNVASLIAAKLQERGLIGNP